MEKEPTYNDVLRALSPEYVEVCTKRDSQNRKHHAESLQKARDKAYLEGFIRGKQAMTLNVALLVGAVALLAFFGYFLNF